VSVFGHLEFLSLNMDIFGELKRFRRITMEHLHTLRLTNVMEHISLSLFSRWNLPCLCRVTLFNGLLAELVPPDQLDNVQFGSVPFFDRHGKAITSLDIVGKSYDLDINPEICEILNHCPLLQTLGIPSEDLCGEFGAAAHPNLIRVDVAKPPSKNSREVYAAFLSSMETLWRIRGASLSVLHLVDFTLDGIEAFIGEITLDEWEEWREWIETWKDLGVRFEFSTGAPIELTPALVENIQDFEAKKAQGLSSDFADGVPTSLRELGEVDILADDATGMDESEGE
jgi:hypothetical protein